MNLNGIICIDKPQDFTSFDVIAKLRGILKTRKLGHAGTLDPMATGVLPVFVGTATKACDILPESDKIYEAGFLLGKTSDTQDITGKFLSEKSFSEIDKEKIENALNSFRGDIMQIPPMYSAVSVNGHRLYELARKGIEIEREPRPITVYKFELLSYDEKTGEGKVLISCSKGTYIRTLINDVGEVLGCGGIMTSLRRTMAAGFEISECVTFEDLQRTQDFSKYVLPIEKVFDVLPKIMLSEKQTEMYKNGRRLDTDRIKFDGGNVRYAVFSFDEFLGTATVDLTAKELKIEKNFYLR